MKAGRRVCQPREIDMKRLAIGLLFALAFIGAGHAADVTLLNVSYDPTRELYSAVNKAFAAQFQAQAGKTIEIKASHGGSGAQARAVADGLQADVVTLALAYDVDVLADRGLVAADWQQRLPQNAAPYTSTIVFLVRKGNPKGIKDWDDLTRSDVKVITPNPKTSGGARWNYLAAWGYGLKKFGSEEKTKEFVKAIYANVPVLDTGARGATVTFVQRNLGDVLIAWENEALLSINEFGPDKFELVVPSLTILTEPPVAVVDKVVDKKGTRAAAESYLQFLYSREGQEIAAKNYYRPRDPDVAKAYEATFPPVQLFTVDEVFGGWRAAQTKHFNDHGVFDEIFSQ
jgi:sulfate/thiosulfate-binding protein